MSWKVEKNHELGFIETVFVGEVTREDVDESTSKALSLVGEAGPSLFLSDLTGARSWLSAFDIYEIPDQWEAEGANRKNRLAVVVTQASVKPEDARFFQTISQNRGWTVAIFEDRQSAIVWLVER